MRVLLQSWGSRGDVEPMIGLAVRLLEDGAEVRLCVPPDEEFHRLLDGLDSSGGAHVERVPFGQSVRDVVTGGGGPAKAPQVAQALVNEWFDTVLPAAEGCDALVATGLMPAGAPSVAEIRGVPYVCALFNPCTLPTPDRPPLARPGRPDPPDADIPTRWRVDAEKADDLYAAPLNHRRAEFGLPPVTNVRDHVLSDHPWLATDPLLDPRPHTPGFDVTQTGAWSRPDLRPLPPDLMEFLDAGAPPVYVGFGSMPLHATPDLPSATLKTLLDQGRRVVASRGWARLAAVPGAVDCFVVDDVNHQALFPRVAAVVHHGGAGTTTTCARAGTPQVIVPQIADQPYWGGRITELGIGSRVSEELSMADALSFALSPGTRSRATALAGSVRTDGTDRAARLISDLVEHMEVPA